MNYSDTENGEMIPFQFQLSQNYPNPFKEKTIIKYCIAYKTRVQLIVFNSEGEKVDTLVDEMKEPGTYEIDFQSEMGNRQLASGNYYYRLEAGEYLSTRKMIVQQ
jgi:hypothetical protein